MDASSTELADDGQIDAGSDVRLSGMSRTGMAPSSKVVAAEGPGVIPFSDRDGEASPAFRGVVRLPRPASSCVGFAGGGLPLSKRATRRKGKKDCDPSKILL